MELMVLICLVKIDMQWLNKRNWLFAGIQLLIRKPLVNFKQLDCIMALQYFERIAIVGAVQLS